jgi:voltage-gated potassium channel
MEPERPCPRRSAPATPSRHLVARQRLVLQTRISRLTAVPLAVLALVWIGLVFVELAVKTPPATTARILRVDTAIWVIFALDFVVEFALAPDKRRYVRNHWPAVVSIVLPFVRGVELVRILEIFRPTVLIRTILISNRALRAAGRLFHEHGFGYVAFLWTITAFLGAGAEYYLEQGIPSSPFQTFGTALWWSLAMLTTVPASVDPVTPAGRFVGLIVRVIALAVGGYITASIASYLIGRKKRSNESPEIAELTRAIVELQARLGQRETE